ncbi:MAG TPA: EAL domain-containing protein [Candidatus Dormibacteraeota bacterium]|nr:EAL domain-containing protein [Candidatus Dormibacteraeota bacterium]
MPAPRRELVVVVTTSPPVPSDRLLPAAFTAAIAAFGAGVIQDVAAGPRQSALLHVLVGPGLRRRALERQMALAIEERLSAGVDGPVAARVQALAHREGAGAVVRELASTWVAAAGPAASISARDNAYLDAVRRLIEGRRLRMVFQPVVEAWTGRVVGYEALCRGPKGDVFESPDAFLDAVHRARMEEAAQVELVGLARRRAQETFPGGDLLLFINLLAEEHWPAAERMSELYGGDGWPWTQVVLEITEKAPVQNPESFVAVLKWARDAGVRFALDDVGAGYSGLSSYALLRPEYTKVDIGLVRGCDQDEVRRAIISSLVSLAHRTGSLVVAEGVETAAELDAVRWLGVDLVQGYLVAPPSEIPLVPQGDWRVPGEVVGRRRTRALRERGA